MLINGYYFYKYFSKTMSCKKLFIVVLLLCRRNKTISEIVITVTTAFVAITHFKTMDVKTVIKLLELEKSDL